MPAFPDAANAAANAAPPPLSRLEDEPPALLSSQPQTAEPQIRPPRPPLSVDFSGYVPVVLVESGRNEDAEPEASRRKRSAAEDGMGMGMMDDAKLDPALTVDASRRPAAGESEGPSPSQSQQQRAEGLAERRAQLMREAEAMRALLEAKERELKELG